MGVCFSWAVAAALALKSKKKIEDTVTIAIAVITMLIFIPGLVVSLVPGIYLALAFCVLCTAFCVFSLFTSRDDYKKYVFTPGGCAFLIFILFFAVFSIGRGFVKSDEFTYWGYILKGYYNYADLRFGKPIHPGISIIWNYFAEKTWLGYSEGMAFWATNALNISMLLPFFKYIKGDRVVGKTIAMGVALFLLPLSVWNWAWNTVMPDAIIGLAVGYSFCAAYNYLKTQDSFMFLQVLTGLYLLSSLKRIGILWAALVIFSIVFLRTLETLEIKDTILLVACSTIPYLLWLGFSLYAVLPVLAATGAIIIAAIYKRFPTILNNRVLQIILALLAMVVVYLASGRLIFSDELNKISTINYCKAVFGTDNVCFGELVRFSMSSLLVAFLVLLLFIRKKNNGKDMYFPLGICVVLSAVLFGIGLWAQYSLAIVSANEGFGQYVPGFERYILGCFYAPIMFGMMVVLEEYHDQLRYSIEGVLITFLLMTNISYATDYVIDKREPIRFYGFENAGITLTQDDNIFAIYEVEIDSATDYTMAMEYGMFPANCNTQNEFTLIDGDMNLCIAPAEFSRILTEGGYNYVYIQTIDENFETVYGEMLDYNGAITSGTVFEVIPDKDGMILLRQK